MGKTLTFMHLAMTALLLGVVAWRGEAFVRVCCGVFGDDARKLAAHVRKLGSLREGLEADGWLRGGLCWELEAYPAADRMSCYDETYLCYIRQKCPYPAAYERALHFRFATPRGENITESVYGLAPVLYYSGAMLMRSLPDGKVVDAAIMYDWR